MLLRDLSAAPHLLSLFTSSVNNRAFGDSGSAAIKYWRGNAELANALQIGESYSLVEYADLRPLLELVLDPPAGYAKWVGAGGRPGRLVPQSGGFESSRSPPRDYSSAPPPPPRQVLLLRRLARERNEDLHLLFSAGILKLSWATAT